MSGRLDGVRAGNGRCRRWVGTSAAAIGALLALGASGCVLLPEAGSTPGGVLNGAPSEATLRGYLSRAVTMSDLFHGIGDFDEHVAFLEETGARFAGRVAFTWTEESLLLQEAATAERFAEAVHARLPDLILQAAVFEIITADVEAVPIPRHVFEAFGADPEERTFSYTAMLSEVPDDSVDFYGTGYSVPDITRLETRMWYYYAGTLYIDAGIEAIHLGQYEWVSRNDRTEHANGSVSYPLAKEVTDRLHEYGRTRARRGWVLLDAHTHGMAVDGELLLDFHSYPLRPEEVDGSYDETTGVGSAELIAGHYDSIYGRSLGGTTPAGWDTDSLPYLVEFDHGYSRGAPELNTDPEFIWRYDEVTWFSLLPEAERNAFLVYAVRRLAEMDPAGYVQMPGLRMVFCSHPGQEDWYDARTGRQQETIAELWRE